MTAYNYVTFILRIKLLQSLGLFLVLHLIHPKANRTEKIYMCVVMSTLLPNYIDIKQAIRCCQYLALVGMLV